MAKSNNLSAREMRELREHQRQYQAKAVKANNVKKVKKTSKKYTAERGTIIRLKAAALILVASMGAIYKMAEDAKAKIEENTVTISSFTNTIEGENPIIEIEGKTFELDRGSYAMVEGEITEGENHALAYDENGRVLEGNVNSENLTGIIELVKDKWRNSDIYRVISEVGAKLTHGEEKANISEGDFVIGIGQQDDCIEVLYPNGDEVLTGEMESQSLEKVSQEYAESYKIEEAMENQSQERQTENQQELPSQAVNLDNTEKRVITNASGTVTGIDVSGMTAEQLRQVLKHGISTSVVKDNGVIVNTTAAAGQINFVQIKLGATPYNRNGKFEPKLNENCKELIKVCEELGVPYGCYWYSIGTNLEQINKEADFTIKAMEEIQNEIDMKYNVIPFAMDVELIGPNDVHLGKDTDEMADAMAHYINRIQESGVSEKVLFYTGGRLVINPNERPEYADSFIDLKRIKEGVKDQENFAVWLCAPINRNGTTPQKTQGYCEMIEQDIGIDIVNKQIALDVKSTYGGLLDIDTIPEEVFREFIGERENPVNLQTLDEDYEI